MTEAHSPDHLRRMKALQEVLADQSVVKKVAAATDVAHIARILNEARADTKGSAFPEDWLNEVVVDVKVSRGPAVPTVDELHHLASSLKMAGTPPKLCHTDSCGGHPGHCC